MPALILEFPARRYHATPWEHHVNEGLIEWPPSPWRLLRALLATGYATLQWSPDGPPTEGRSLIEKLASTLPFYQLPKAIATHSRHYMPTARFKNGREETTLVFDTWARICGELVVSWSVDLTTPERTLLEQLASHMNYLGRSESWVSARIACGEGDFKQGERCWPEGSEPAPGPGWEQIPLYAPISASEYARWRENALNQIEGRLARPAPGKRPTAKMRRDWEKAIKAYPVDLIACLQMQTNELQAFGWNQPPGSRRVFYWRKANALEVSRARRRPVRVPSPIEAVLLSITPQSGNEHALPPIKRALPQAELLHRQLVRSLRGRHCKALSGCDEQGRPLREPHTHAHILPIDLNEDGHLDHILIWAPMGLDADAQSTIRRMRETFTKGGIGPLRLTVAGSATSVGELAGLHGQWGEHLKAYVGAHREWISYTPFVPPRYMKKRGINTLEGQVQSELASRRLPQAQSIQVLDPHENDLARRHRHVVRVRRFGPRPPTDCGFTLKVSFAEPIPGPLSLGYGSHYGLGLFSATG